MIDMRIVIPESIKRFMKVLHDPGRHNIFSAAAAAVCDLTRRHIAAQASRRHLSARRLGAAPTGFLEMAARKTVFHADGRKGEVVIPSPGFGRAFHDVVILPRAKQFLTLPVHALSYGRRAGEMRSLGWRLFRPLAKGSLKSDKRKQNILMGTRDGQTVCLYILKRRVQQRQDRALLPSDADITTTAARAMYSEIRRVQRKAGL